MANIRVSVSVEGQADLLAALDDVLNKGHFKVVKRANCCRRCRANDDPERVPVHPMCHCHVVYEND